MPSACPALPRLTVNIGVTGHRSITPEQLPGVRHAVACFLQRVKEQVEPLVGQGSQPLVQELYAAAAPRFVLLSSLAEGADCIVAEEALAQGYQLHVPLPMAREEYEKDFENPESLATFRHLLAQAREAHIFEIVDANPERAHAYEDAARIVLNHSDLLVALWDGRDTGSVAGTAATVQLAIRQHIPVIHIHPDGSVPTCIIIDGCRTTNWEEKMEKHFHALLLPVEAQSTDADKRFARACARQQDVSDSQWFPQYLGLPGLFFRTEQALRTLLRWQPWGSPSQEELERVQKDADDTLPDEERFTMDGSSVLQEWKGYFTRFDRYSNAYSVRYRSGLVWRYLAPVLAIACLTCALNWPAFADWGFLSERSWMALWFVLQLLFLSLPVFLQFMDWRNMWHRKFFSYRVVGEQLRQTVRLGPVGFLMVRPRESTYTDSPQRWTAWYYRALVRHVGLPGARVNHAYLVDWLLWARNCFVVEQFNYHAGRGQREGGMCRRLVLLGIIMFALSIAAALGRGGLLVAGCSNTALQSLVSACALCFPALAVFFAGFCAYACYAKNQQVSLASSDSLRTICREMDGFLTREGYDVPLSQEEACYLLPQPLHFTQAYNIAEQINDCCKGELLGWEDLISTRGIKHQ